MAGNMFSQRAVQMSMRRLVAVNSSTLSRNTPFARLSVPAAIATGHRVQFRPATTTSVTQEQAYDILAAQRRNRPISPHLAIYRPQITWYASAFNRITGAVLSSSLYIFGAAYLVAPLIGWHLESASLAASFAALPLVVKVLIKSFFAIPFTFHGFNGIRHLIWDVGAQLTNKQVIATGWTVVGLSVVSALGLVFFL